MKSLSMTLFTALLVMVVATSGLSASPSDVSPPAGIAAPFTDATISSATRQDDLLTPKLQGDPNPGDAAASWLAISAGGMHTCGIHTDGGLECWGDNSFGQLNAPVGQFVRVSAGLIQSCAIRTDGKLLCWGAANAIPAKPPKAKFKDVSAGDNHTCAIRADDRIVCWGNKTLRQTRAPAGRFAALSAGGRHTCALRIDGRLVCWGEQSFMAYARPAGRFRDIATGEVHACALRDDDRIVCWGNDTYGAATPPEGSFKSLVAGSFHSCGLRFDGTAACWGRNEWGQTAVPVDERFKAISAGGAHACGMRLDDTLECWGSHNNEMIGDELPVSGVPYNFLMQVNGFLGSGMSLFGKGVEQKWTGPGSNIVKLQLGLLGASVVMSALQSFMPAPPDPVADSLIRMEAHIAELKAAVERIESALNQIQAKLNTLACNVSLQPLVNASVKIKTAQQIYAKRMIQAQIVLKAYAARAKDPTTQVPEVSQDLEKFVRDHENALLEALNAIDETLVPALSSKTGPLEECMKKSFEQWKAVAKSPFDDRTYYEPVYEILGYALANQNLALTMLQDINLWHAQQRLQAGKINYSPGELVGFCAIIREKAKNIGDTRAYWQQAQAACDDATQLTLKTYENMVKQIERAGAPHTADDVVLSLGSGVIGKGYDWAHSSWLWVRDVDAYGNTKGKFSDGLQKPEVKWFTKDSEFQQYDKWVANGGAWRNAEEVLFNQMTGNEQKDLPTLMEDEIGFKHVKNRVFWLSEKTFDVKWHEVADTASYELSGFEEASTNNMKCFAASGIHHPFKQERRVNGVVCAQVQLQNFAWRTTWAQGGFWDGYIYDVGSRINDDNGYNQYAPILGEFWGRWGPEEKYPRGPRWKGIQQSARFFPDQDGEMYRWPVLDVEWLKPTYSMVDNTAGRKCINVVNAPTRCGNDLDRVINAIVPRPASLPARVPLEDRVKRVGMSLNSLDMVCNHITEYEDRTDWLRSKPYQWEAVSPDTGKSVIAERNNKFDWLSGLAKLEPNDTIKVFRVRCGTEVKHGPTGTRYEVVSPWYVFNRANQQLRELPAE